VASEDPIDALLSGLGRDPDDALSAAAAGARSRRRWLLQQARQSATMGGLLMTLAEREAPLTLRCGPWSHHGRLRSVTATLVIAEVPDGLALLPTAAITAVETSVVVTDDREPSDGPDLETLLAAMALDHPPVRLLLTDGSELGGTLEELGKDVAMVRLASSVTTVRLSALAGCVLLALGTDQDDGSGDVLASPDDFGSG
jgi:hypothetical protein